jgi:hypothetical protein
VPCGEQLPAIHSEYDADDDDDDDLESEDGIAAGHSCCARDTSSGGVGISTTEEVLDVLLAASREPRGAPTRSEASAGVDNGSGKSAFQGDDA